MRSFEAKCKTTAMGIMPHRDIEKALELALSLDIPFWPQLPNVSLYEDMYIQTSENFPGIEIDKEKERLVFDTERFQKEIEDYFIKMEDPNTYALSKKYSLVFDKFLSKDLTRYVAIRGQVTGPVSFGFKVLDENLKPIIYNDEVKSILFDFIQKKVNYQYEMLKAKNPNAFVWVDEPGLGYVFSGLSGYNDQQAKRDYYDFVQGLSGPKGLHLCADVNLPYLLDLGVEILSFDAFQIGFMPKEYTQSVYEFLNNGGIISWGIVPTHSSILSNGGSKDLVSILINYWNIISENTGLDQKQIAIQSLIAPSRCCLKDISSDQGSCEISNIEEKIVEKAFSLLLEISNILKERFSL
jgi:hypothetical protein